MGNFTIDFFELAFLAEACIPPRPIARSCFWQNLTEKYWHKMTETERIHLFEWLNKDYNYKQSLETQLDTKIFNARFDPNNQFLVKVIYDGKEEIRRAFLFSDKYYVGTNTHISEENIVSVEKFIPKREY